MKLCYVGYAVEGSNKKYSGISIAGNKMQQGILGGLSKLDECEVESISIPPYASYPANKFYVNAENRYLGDIKNTEVGFINVPILKQLNQAFSVFKNLFSKRNEIDEVLCFNAYFPIALPVLLFAFLFKKPTTAFIADVPLDDNENRPIISKFIYTPFYMISKFLLSKFKKVVVLNENAAFKFCPNANYIVVEGGVDIFEHVNRVESAEHSIMSPKIVVYTGALTDYSGVKNLVRAFDFLSDDDVELHIYGGGYLKNWLVDAVKSRSNVIYKGCVDNLIAIKAQESAWLLVNPRVIGDEISNYTFPSKLLEYMQSGTAVLTTNISGITEEYRSAIYITKDDTSAGFAKAIQYILEEKDENFNIMQANSLRVVKSKAWDLQAKRILDFLRSEERV